MQRSFPARRPSNLQPGLSAPAVFRNPRRISITLPEQVYQELLRRSDVQGRSLSNLAAFLLEQAIHQHQDAEAA